MQTTTEVQRRIIASPQQRIMVGLELLDQSDNVLQDISSDFKAAGSVSHQNYATIHGSVSGLILARELVWGRDRIRPYMVMADAQGSARFNLGVFIPTTPARSVGQSIPEFSITGYDKLYLLGGEVGDSYWIPQGTSYLDAVGQVLTASGYPGLKASIEQDAASTVLEAPMAWPLDADKPVTWIRIINDLLAAISYRGLWVDNDGVLRTGPYRTVGERSPEWTFDLADARTNIVFQERTVVEDAFNNYNWWRYIRAGYKLPLSENNGQTTIDRSNGARRLKKVRTLEVADQQSLILAANREVEADLLRTRTVSIKTGALPALGHFDVFSYIDPDLGSFKSMARSWSLDLATASTQIEMEVVT